MNNTTPEIHEKVISVVSEYFDNRISEIRILLNVSIEHFKDELMNVEEKYGTGIFSFDDREKRSPEEIIKESVALHRNLFRSQFEEILTKSLLIMSYSVFENSLNLICQNQWIESKYSSKLTDMKGKGIFRAFSYLEKIVGISIDRNDLFSKISMYNKIRNVIVHTDGNLDKAEKFVINFLEKNYLLNFDNSKIQIYHTFLFGVTDDYFNFMLGIYNKLHELFVVRS